jgi:hypothetical protein
MLGWDQYGFEKKCTKTRYADLVFLHLVGSAGHVMHSGASGERNIDILFSCSGGSGTDLRKSGTRHVMLNFSFCIRWDLHVT